MFRFEKIQATIGILTSVAVMAACGDDGTGPDAGVASVEGRVEATSPPASSASRSAPQAASGPSAQTVAVVQVQGDGSFTQLASAEIEAGGTFTIEGVPAGRSDLAVVAYADGEAVGSVLVHEESRGGVTIVTAPIDEETTLETRTYTHVRASSSGEASTSSELSLLVHADGLAAEAAATSEAELEAIATAYAAASAAVTATYSMSGEAFDASARGEVLADAAVEFAADRHSGVSATVANMTFAEAALDAFVAAEADLETTVLATAAAASTFDAALEQGSSIRSDLDTQPIHLNLLARERLSASFGSSTSGSVAVAIEDVLADARATLSLGIGIIDLRALLDGVLVAAADAGADACVSLLAAGASATVEAEVRARAEAAFEVAQLDVRLQSATTADAAASAMEDYRADVQAAVEAMIEASGSTTADAQALTTLLIAAGGGAYIR
jgi:hypothetical protein